jgi:hypothetical protein
MGLAAPSPLAESFGENLSHRFKWPSALKQKHAAFICPKTDSCGRSEQQRGSINAIAWLYITEK